MDIEQFRDFCLSLPHSSESMPFGEDLVVFKVVDRIFAILSLAEGEPRVSMKCSPDRVEELRARYDAVTPGYHLNKRYWNTVYLDRDLPLPLLRQLIRHSWNEASAKLTKRVRTSLALLPLEEVD